MYMYVLYCIITTLSTPLQCSFRYASYATRNQPPGINYVQEKKQTIPLPSTSIDMYNELRTPCSDEYIHRILYKQRDLSTLSTHYSNPNEGERKEKIGMSCAISRLSLTILQARNLALSQARS